MYACQAAADHLVSAGQHCRWNRYAQGLRGPLFLGSQLRPRRRARGEVDGELPIAAVAFLRLEAVISSADSP
jgi:hypothetical protein